MTTNGEMERRPPADNATPHFLAMMVRAPRAVDLSAKSGAFGPTPALAGFPAWKPPMLLPSQPLPSVPEDTARIACAAFRRRNPYVLLRDKLGAVFANADFADLYPKLGQPAYVLWRLALVTLIQFREGLSDRHASDAVRGRSDWKYLLALDLADAGFDLGVSQTWGGLLARLGRISLADA